MDYLFVPYEIALEMKLLKFDEASFGAWDRPDKLWIGHVLGIDYTPDDTILAPTFAQCFKFFREKYSMPCKIEVCQIVSVNEYYYFYQILTSSHIVGDGIEQNLTYEEAELACVTKLINIVKNKKP